MKKGAVRLISLSLLLAVLMALGSCGIGISNGGDDSNSTQTGKKTQTETVTDTGSGYTLNGFALESYGVYYAWRDRNGEKKYTLELVDRLKQLTGVELTVKSDYDGLSEHAIVVGDSDHCTPPTKASELASMQYYVDVAGGIIQLLSSTKYGYRMAMENLCGAFGETKSATVNSTGTLSYEDLVLSSMTFNIYNWDTSADHLQRIKQVIKKFQPDTIGFQEITETWISDIMADSEISTMYGEVGESRADDTREQCAIFYRKDRFRLVSSDTKWLFGNSTSTGSDTAGRLKQSLYNRIYTYAVLERLSDGKQFAHINIHLDLGTEATRINVQSQQIVYALNMAEQLLKDEKISAVVFTGDFNARKEETPCTMITDAGFVYAQDRSDRTVGSIVENEYYKDTQNVICKWIDHIFIKGDVYFEEYEICNQKYRGEYPSDHLPRIARYIIQ